MDEDEGMNPLHGSKSQAQADFERRLNEFVGKAEGPTTYAVVDPTVVARLVEALGDMNPVYSDAAAAEKSRHGGLVAPVTALQSWTVSAKPLGRHGVDRQGRRVFRLEASPNGSASTLTEEEIAEQPAQWGTGVDMREFLKSEGYVAPAVTNGWFEYKRYLKPGERLSIAAPRIDEIAGPKSTGLGVGYFITQSQQILDEAGQVVAVIRQRMLRAKPAPKADGEPADPVATAEPVKISAMDDLLPDPDWTFGRPQWAPSLTTATVGDRLPELVVDLTPTLVAAGAIGSQDWAPVHHDVEFARALGRPNLFMNIQISTGFVGRFITDWAGENAVIETLDLRLGVPSYVLDTMSITGEVMAVEHLEHVDRITVAVVAHNSIGVHISSNVTLTAPRINVGDLDMGTNEEAAS